MIRLSIRRKIMAIAVALIVLMSITAVLSMISVIQVSRRIEVIAHSLVPAYGHLARLHIRSLERALALRRIRIHRQQSPSDTAGYTALLGAFEAKGTEVEREAKGARDLIVGLIESAAASDDTAALSRLETRIDVAMNNTRRRLNAEIEQLLYALSTADAKTITDEMARVDIMRDELNAEFEAVRAGTLVLLNKNSEAAVRRQHEAALISIALTVFAAILGLLFALLVSSGLAKPVRRLLDGTRDVEAGRLDKTLVATSTDEIGQLTEAFNRMVEQLRHKERIRETFGKYIDPRVVEGLIDRPTLATEGQRRVMTILFCDVKGFSSTSEGMTAQGLVKIMNRYFSTMSAPIRQHGGIIDKYIGDAIMAYWGPPFGESDEQTRLASLAALDMVDRIAPLKAEFPELLGLRNVPIAFDIRIGIATGEVLVGSIGSDLMMSYTVIGETVNFASRLEGASKIYGTRILVSEQTAADAAAAIETREIDRVVMLGQTKPQAVFEIMGRKGALDDAQLRLRARFAEGLAAYRARRWGEARSAFAAALEAVPDDGPSKTFIERIERFAASPPPDGWDTSWQLDSK